LPTVAQEHLASCSACQDFYADLGSIVALAGELPAESDPPQRVWVSLRAQLEAEGLIKEPLVVTANSSSDWLQNLRAWFTPRSLATVGAGLALAVAAFLQLHKPNTPVAAPALVAKQQLQLEAPQQVAQQQVSPQVQQSAPNAPAQIAAPNLQATEPVLVPPPSGDVYYARSAALNQAETDASSSNLAGNPALDEALRKNLSTVNGFIAECEAHLKKHPQDTLAREYLNSAYQQKAELLAAILDSGRSEQ